LIQLRNLQKSYQVQGKLTAFYTYFPVNQKAVEAKANWAGEAKTHVGNGPFKMEPGEHKSKVVLVKNDSYWDKDTVNLDKIDFKGFKRRCETKNLFSILFSRSINFYNSLIIFINK